MTAMPDTAVIVTGLVGAAGIAGTLFSAKITAKSNMAGLRLSITAEDKRAQLADKRRIYAAFDASIDRLVILYGAIHEDWATASPAEREAMRSGQDAAMTALLNGLGEIRLIAPEAIGRQADNMARLMTNYGRTVLTDSGSDVADDAFEQRSALYEAMRADLGTGHASPG
jgi:hypothetical protein